MSARPRSGAGSGRRDERGQALVELALILPLLVILLAGMFDVARAIQISGSLGTAAREGARYAAVHGALSAAPQGPGNDAAVVAEVRRYAAAPGTVAVTVGWPDGNANRGSRVTVDATFPFTPVLSAAFLGGGFQVTLRGGTQVVIEQ